MDTEAKNREQRLRRWARRLGLTMKKSRGGLSIDNYGDYMLLDTARWYCVAGSRFDLTLDDVEAWLAKYASEE